MKGIKKEVTRGAGVEATKSYWDESWEEILDNEMTLDQVLRWWHIAPRTVINISENESLIPSPFPKKNKSPWGI